MSHQQQYDPDIPYHETEEFLINELADVHQERQQDITAVYNQLRRVINEQGQQQGYLR